MILEFSVENTLSIREMQTISLEAVESAQRTDFDFNHIISVENAKILKLACIYGANASGKTNMLSALSYYLDFMTESFFNLKPNEPTGYIPFRFERNEEMECGRFNLVFFAPLLENSDRFIKYTYDLRLTEKEVLEETLFVSPKGQRSLIFQREKNVVKWGAVAKGSKKMAQSMLRSNSSMVSVGVQANIPILKHIYDYISKRLRTIDIDYVIGKIEKDDGFKNKVIGLLKSTDFGSISDIHVETKNVDTVTLPESVKNEFERRGEKPQVKRTSFIHTYEGQDYSLPLHLESKGTSRILGIAGVLSMVSDSVLVLEDELERSIHPDLVEAFLKLVLLISKDSQLIFTTHNTDLLESGLLRDDEVWFAYKTDKGNSVYSSISDFTGVRSETSRKKLYKAGKFGALPLIDMVYLKELFDGKEDKKD